MPYKIESVGGGRYKVVNVETGNVHSKATTKANAEAQVRLLHGVEHNTLKPRTTREVMGTMPMMRTKGSSHKTHKGKGKSRK